MRLAKEGRYADTSVLCQDLFMNTPKSADSQKRILEVANRLFYAEGVRATGTEKILAIAEVAKATFYRHFQSKDDLVLAYLDLRDRSFWEYLASPAPAGHP